MVLAFHVAGMIDDWSSIGAASGGSIPAGILATKMSPQEFLPQVLKTDIEGLLAPRKRLTGRILAILRKYHYERTKPRRGAYSTHKLRRFINSMFPEWPERMWLVAGCPHGQLLFTATGVFKYSQNGQVRNVISATPPSMGLAVCASCSIPGVIDSVKYRGEQLFDGALSGDGEVPVDVVQRHFGGTNHKTIALDIGPDPIKKRQWLRLLWNIFCGGTCETSIDAVHPQEREDLIIVRPQVVGFHALQFKLQAHEKWHAIIAGFVATAIALVDNNLVDERTAITLNGFAQQLSELDKQRRDKRLFIKRVEDFLRDNNLYAME